MRRTMPPALRALAHRNYRLWATADLVSVTGSWMQVLGLNWVVLARTGSATSLGISILLSTLPGILLGPWAGALADRFPARRIITLGQTIHVALAVLLALVVATDGTLALIYALTAIAGVVTTFEGPALGRFAGEVVPPSDLGNALALGSIINSTGRVLGMSLAGVLAATIGEPSLFLVNAASFLAVLATVRAIRTDELIPLPLSTPDRAGVRAGFGYLRGRTRLLTLFALGFVLSGLGRNYQVTMAAMTQGPLGSGPAGYGLLSAVFAVGTVIGGIIAARMRHLSIPVLLGAAAITSVLQVTGGLTTGMVAFALVILPIAAGAVLIDTTMSTRIQLDSASDMRGRVIAAHGAVSATAGAVSAPLLGWLCEWPGPQTALVLAGAIALTATAAAATHFRRLSSKAPATTATTTIPTPAEKPLVPA
ncbi:MFS transporter [Actinokineospora iranica]|uniref:Predicted arabinose efflux permease, MFS family n=1 Tax=Actinokineospora iranica TaxID=1271860 RepID=A0A1G6WRH9_9PSEU|nr:MFS transporter [Actinokineospora iranica]SDD67706.1 Predicted arabinose efflux permease, MFS family [Actinokineospora iranica]